MYSNVRKAGDSADHDAMQSTAKPSGKGVGAGGRAILWSRPQWPHESSQYGQVESSKGTWTCCLETSLNAILKGNIHPLVPHSTGKCTCVWPSGRRTHWYASGAGCQLARSVMHTSTRVNRNIAQSSEKCTKGILPTCPRQLLTSRLPTSQSTY